MRYHPWNTSLLSATSTLTQSFLGLTLALFTTLGHWNPIGYVSAFVPVAIPFALILLHIFVAFLQAFVFVILPVVYLGLAVSEH